MPSLLRDLDKVRNSNNEAGLNNALAEDGLTGTMQSRVLLHCLVSDFAVNYRKEFLHTGRLDGLLVII